MPTVLGDYDLLTRLASGGMAEVYVARSWSTGDIVIVKQMLQKFVHRPEFVEMFLDEGRVISSLHHPNIVAMRDFGFHDELPYLAMEYLHGVDLRTLMRTFALRRRMMPLESAIFIVRSICAGLHHAHDARSIDGRPMEIIHRDVSPQNVVVTFGGDVKLIDFGIAKARGRSHETRSGTLKGKVPYMSPEQVRAGTVDRRTDVYAAGVMLYELVVGKRPYVGLEASALDEFGLMMAIVNHDMVPASAVRVGLQPMLDDIIMKALEANAADRYQTAQQLEQALASASTELGLMATREQLADLMLRTLGQQPSWASAARSNDDVVEQVASLEHCKTMVGEDLDPVTVDPAEVAPELRLKTTGVRETDTIDEASKRSSPSTSSPIVEKIVDANVTRLRFRRAIEAGFRWGRLFDGIEGVVEIDFSGTEELTASSVSAVVSALRSLGPEVSEIRLIAAPPGLAGQTDDRCRVLTVAAHGWCPTCKTTRAIVLAPDVLRARLPPGGTLPCPQCNTSMVVQPPPADEVARTETPARGPVSAGPIPAASLEVAVVAAPASGRRRGWLYVGAGLAALVSAGAVLWLADTGRSPGAGAGLRSGSRSGSSWEEGDRVLAEGRAIGATKDAAVAGARANAIRNLIREVETRLPDRIKALHGPATDIEIVANVEVQLGAWIRFELRDLTAQGDPVEAITRYSLSRADLDRAVTFYSAQRRVWGLELVNAPPSRSPGVLVVAGEGAAIVAGDRIVAADREPLGSLDAITPALLARPQLELTIEHREHNTILIRNGPE